MSKKSGSPLTTSEAKKLIDTLKSRFEKHQSRHPGIEWKMVEDRISKENGKLRPLYEMEKSGGEPDVVGFVKKTGAVLFMDCSAESPSGRRSLCFDKSALDSRKEAKPSGSAMQMAEIMGVEILTEQEYRFLQSLGDFDLKTSSWVQTPADIRKAGGALFCDKRYGHVFLYHNGAQSYYAARGFRGKVVI